MPLLPLCPAEAQAVYDLQGTTARDAVKTTILGLLAKGTMRYVADAKEAGWLRKAQPGFRTREPDWPSLATCEADVVSAAQSKGTGTIAMDDFVKAMASRFGPQFKTILPDSVYPELVRRGLVERRVEPMLWVLKRTTWTLTPSGEAERRTISHHVEQVRRLPALLGSDPAKAAAIALAAGAALFLVPELIPHYDRLAAVMKQHADIGADGGYDFSSSASGGSDASCAFDGLSGALDSCMSALDSFDSAADSGGGGDGGDGGGDGGGGGGD